MIPKDPVILLSFLNMKLRDYYKSLEELCDDLGLEEAELTVKLDAIGYYYNRERNQFV